MSEPKTKFALGVMERQDRRYLRAMQLHAAIMQIVYPHLRPEADTSDISNALMELFMQQGVEVLTDQTRSEIGLAPRDARGWTIEEILTLERRRLELMTAPMPPMVFSSSAALSVFRGEAPSKERGPGDNKSE